MDGNWTWNPKPAITQASQTSNTEKEDVIDIDSWYNSDGDVPGVTEPDIGDTRVPLTSWTMWANGMQNDGQGKGIERTAGRTPAFKYKGWRLYDVVTIPMMVGGKLVNEPPRNVLLSDDIAGHLFALRCQKLILPALLGEYWPGDFTREGFPIVNREPRGRPCKMPDADGVLRYLVAHYTRMLGREAVEIRKPSLVVGVNFGRDLKSGEKAVAWLDDSIEALDGDEFTLLDLSRCDYINHLMIPNTWRKAIPKTAAKSKDCPKDAIRAIAISRDEVLKRYPSFFKTGVDARTPRESSTKRKAQHQDASGTAKKQKSELEPGTASNQKPYKRPAGIEPVPGKPGGTGYPVGSPGRTSKKNRNRSQTPTETYYDEAVARIFGTSPSSTEPGKTSKPPKANTGMETEYLINWAGLNIKVPDTIEPVNEMELSLMKRAQMNPSNTDRAFLHTIAALQTLNKAFCERLDGYRAINDSEHTATVEKGIRAIQLLSKAESLVSGLTIGIKKLKNTNDLRIQEDRKAAARSVTITRVATKDFEPRKPSYSQKLDWWIYSLQAGAENRSEKISQEIYEHKSPILIDNETTPGIYLQMNTGRTDDETPDPNERGESDRTEDEKSDGTKRRDSDSDEE